MWGMLGVIALYVAGMVSMIPIIDRWGFGAAFAVIVTEIVLILSLMLVWRVIA